METQEAENTVEVIDGYCSRYQSYSRWVMDRLHNMRTIKAMPRVKQARKPEKQWIFLLLWRDEWVCNLFAKT